MSTTPDDGRDQTAPEALPVGEPLLRGPRRLRAVAHAVPVGLGISTVVPLS